MRFAVLTLAGTYHETGGASPAALAGGRRFAFDRFYLQARALMRSRAVERILVVADSSFRAGFSGGLEAIRAVLERLAACGKDLWFSADDYADATLYLASACRHRVMHPMGSLRCVGLHRQAFFFKRLMDRYGVQVQVVRRGRYKSAYDRFLLEHIDPLNLKQYSRWLGDSAAVLHHGIRSGYGESAPLGELLDGRLLDAEEAREAGWVDSVATRHELLADWRRQKMRKAPARAPRAAGRGRTVAVLVVEGAITRGRSGFNPLLGATIGADTLIAEIDRLSRARSVAAVVLRVNSGGGDAAASDDIRLALARLAEKKPLVVSMAEVAGSGGYLIASAGHRLFTHHATLTGSVGAIALSPALGAALEQAGITGSTITTHEHADAMAGIRPLSEAELHELDSHVASVYRRFVGVVAQSRKRPVEEIEDVAQGRVWSGRAAVERGLADEAGDLDAAIASAAGAAGAARVRVEFFPRPKRTFLQRRLTRMLAGMEVGGLAAAVTRPAAVTASMALRELCGRPLLLEPAALDHVPALDDVSIGLD